MPNAPKRPKAPPETQGTQSERFITIARELGADESEERFNARLKKVAGAKVSEPETPKHRAEVKP